jgi:hypothetical protein
METESHAEGVRQLAKLCLVAALVCILSGCQSTQECGSWVFNGTPQSVGGYNSFPLTVAFTFDPATCGKNCNCDTDCMVQMVWVYDTVDKTYLYAGTGDRNRATANGWTIDRVDGSGEGYYGLLNDGTTFYSGWNTTGGNGTANTLIDDPSGWGANTFFAAVDAAVCFKSKTCENTILGYYYWSWTIDSTGQPAIFITAPAWKDLDAEFQTALASWNAWAPTSGQENSGIAGQPVLNQAVLFPALPDL